MNRRDFLSCHLNDPSRPAASVGPGFYTNAVFRTHENKPVRFYEDLIKGKISVINFMYASCTRACPRSTANLAKVQKMLGDRVGRDIFMYSISIKPLQDDPAKLKDYAHAYGVKPGWLFLTGNEYDTDTVRFKLARWDQPMLDFDLDQHTGMVRIINDNFNQWTMCPLHATPRQIVETISWLEPTKPFAERLRENFAKQAKIDEETHPLQPQWAEFRRTHGWPVEATRKREAPDAMKHLQSLIASV
jgi:protein SCO1/2